MTKQEAIKEINLYREFASKGLEEALNVAIESMEKLIKLEKWMEDNSDDMR